MTKNGSSAYGAGDLSRTFEYKSRFRNSPIYKALKYIFGADFIPYDPLRKFHGLFLDKVSKGGRVLNVGSGSTRLAEGIINVDMEPFPNVDVVADGCRLPFEPDTFNAVISEVVIEHVKDPKAYIDEIKRVLKKGGAVFIIAPFVCPFHGYPSDFQRYSIEGLRALFEDFVELESGVYRGPSVAFVNFVSDYLSGLISWNPKARIFLKSLFTLPLFLLKFLDIFLNRKNDAFMLAHCVYYLGKK